MSKGTELIGANVCCSLCGGNGGLKTSCSEEGCRCWGQRRGAYSFHVTCAREAGLEVRDRPDGNRFFFDTKCFIHSGEDFAFRARMEDLIEIERNKFGKRFEKREAMFMSWAHASRLFNKAVIVMKMLGWAWRWAEWWVEFGDNWEPLLEPGEREEDMTKEELKIVDSTRESRCEAARRCRLAAFGAALRNRDYDREPGDDRVALHRALTAILHTPELVGPLEQYEIDFFAEWLARAYRSKSRLLGFGDDKIPIHDNVRTLHIDDQSPKYVLGARRLPGKQELPNGKVFETGFRDVDDFLKPEMYDDGTLVTEDSLRSKRGTPVAAVEDTKESPRMSRRGTRSQYGSHAQGDETGSKVTLKAVYTEAATDDRMDLLPSPVEAVVTNPSGRGSRKRKSQQATSSQERPKKKRGRGGWPKGRKRNQKPPPDDDVAEASNEDIAEEDEEVMPVPKRRGRPPTTNEPVSQEHSQVPPRKRMGRPPKTRQTSEVVAAAADSGETEEQMDVPGDAPVTGATSGDDAAMIQDMMIGNIAERIKRRRGGVDPVVNDATSKASDKARSDTDDEKPVSSNEDSGTQDDSSGASSPENSESTDDNITIAAYVQTHKGKQSESPSSEDRGDEGHEEDTSGSSSEQSEEVPVSELSPSQRGRKQGKINASRSMWN